MPCPTCVEAEPRVDHLDTWLTALFASDTVEEMFIAKEMPAAGVANRRSVNEGRRQDMLEARARRKALAACATIRPTREEKVN